MKRSKPFILTGGLVSVFGFDGLFFDRNWQTHMGMDIITDDFSPSNEELEATTQ